jgi:hypothetical protein
LNNKNLPIVSTFLEALSFPYKHYRLLLKVGLPLIITEILGTTLSHFFSDSESTALAIFSILLNIAFYLSLVMAIVGCHRIFLLDSSVVEGSNLFNWTGNEIKYIGWMIFIGLCASLIPLPLILMTSLENFLAIAVLINIPICYVISRWSLVLPSSAIDIHGKNLTWSWELSDGNGWRLTLLIGFLPFIMDIVFSSLPTCDSIIYSLFHGAAWLIVGCIEVGLLSLSYKFLVST